MKSIQLAPDGPFAQRPRSDTVFGALCWGIRDAHGEATLEEYLADFADGSPPFLISSAYPTLEIGGAVCRFLPKPRLPTATNGAVSDARVKAINVWKQLDFIPLALFRSIATGSLTKSDILSDMEGQGLVIDGQEYDRDGSFLIPNRTANSDDESSPESEASQSKPYARGERVRNAVNRLTNSTDGQLFQEESIYFAEGGGLHVMASGDTEMVVDALSIVQDRGLGGRRSVGRGQFNIENIEDIDLPDPTGGYFCTLSLCIPDDEELDQQVTDGYYDIETRKGVLEAGAASGGVWKRRVLTLTEGSVLPTGESPHGHNPIVADEFEHGVQQFGYAFPVGMAALEGHS